MSPRKLLSDPKGGAHLPAPILAFLLPWSMPQLYVPIPEQCAICSNEIVWLC